MKKRWCFALALSLPILLSGCAMGAVEEMYALPKRSQEYQHLQMAIDEAMGDLTYCAPQSGENQQTVQTADLDGDGQDEYLVFATGGQEKPLQVLIFQQNAAGACSLMDVIQSNGTSFEQVEYVNFDEKPGLELVIGRQVSDQVLRSVSVYSFSGGSAELVLMNSYSKFITCDLDNNSRSELMVIRTGESAAEGAVAVLYGAQSGKVQRSMEVELSANIDQIRRISRNALQSGEPAVYVSSVVGGNAVVTDVLSFQDNKLGNVSRKGGSSVQPLKNFYVYPEDLDGDGVLELPQQVTMKAVSLWGEEDQKFLLRWFSLDGKGREVEKMYTFHDYLGGWYVQLDPQWANRVTVEQEGDRYTFFLWNEDFVEATALFTIYRFAGGDRDEKAGEEGRFPLYRGEGITYSAQLERYADRYHITKPSLIESFHLIRQDWQTGDIEK